MNQISKTNRNRKKFRIREMIADQTKNEQAKVIRDLAELCNVSPEQMRKIAAATFGSSQDMNTTKLRLIADYFGVTANEILNRPRIRTKKKRAVLAA